MTTRTSTEDREAARARIRALDARQAAYDAQPRKAAAVDALTLCNACEAATAHDGCAAGYCAGCCTAH